MGHRLARAYNENYVSLPMDHLIEQQPTQLTAEYQWKYNGRWQKIRVSCHGNPHYPLPGSEAEFITEHYWGYNTLQNGDTIEYQVQHSPWRVWEVDSYTVDVDMKTLYGSPFTPFLENSPTSVFLAEGSEVMVFKGETLPFV